MIRIGNLTHHSLESARIYDFGLRFTVHPKRMPKGKEIMEAITGDFNCFHDYLLPFMDDEFRNMIPDFKPLRPETQQIGCTCHIGKLYPDPVTAPEETDSSVELTEQLSTAPEEIDTSIELTEQLQSLQQLGEEIDEPIVLTPDTAIAGKYKTEQMGDNQCIIHIDRTVTYNQQIGPLTSQNVLLAPFQLTNKTLFGDFAQVNVYRQWSAKKVKLTCVSGVPTSRFLRAGVSLLPFGYEAKDHTINSMLQFRSYLIPAAQQKVVEFDVR